MVERRGGKFKYRSKWKPLYGGAEGRESSNKEIKRRSLYGGAEAGKCK